MKRREFLFLASGALTAGLTCASRAAEAPDITIYGTPTGLEKPVPISLAGFSGEVASVLRFDLEVMGCEIVAPDAASFHVSGTNDGQVVGELRQSATKAVLLNNRYTGGALRTQAHKFANDVIERVTGRKGIAQTRIAFRVQSGNDWDIYIADFDGANPHKITPKSALVAAPAWTPGQNIIYYTSYESGSPDIYSQNLGTGVRKVVASYRGMSSSAAVSPDGRRIAMILSKSGNPKIYVADADGSDARQLTKSAQVEACPCWSPDGSRICFVSSTPGVPSLNVISAAGGASRRLATTGASRVTEPDWSPDGKQIIFTIDRGNGELGVVSATGGDVRLLGTGEDPSWAPNSRTVIFSRKVNGRSVLSLLDVPTKRTKDVPLNLGNSSQPSWAR